MLRLLFSICFFTFSTAFLYGQGCCSGGAGNPIAGNAATGVLQKDQLELALSYQFFRSDKFFAGSESVDALYNNLNSNYFFIRTDYGLSERLSISLGTGYFVNRTLVELDEEKTIGSGGMGDFIFLPRFNIYRNTNLLSRTELTLGVGLKLPLGKHDQSYLVFTSPLTGDVYAYAPPMVQTTNGSQDLLFNAFFFRSYAPLKLNYFSNFLYIKKSFNSLGQKFGDYASLGIFVGRTFYSRFGITTQLRAEWTGEMKAADGVDLLGQYNIETESTGGRKLFFIPQLSYSRDGLTYFISGELPVYQHMNGTQIGSQYQITTGLIWRFMTRRLSSTQQ